MLVHAKSTETITGVYRDLGAVEAMSITSLVGLSVDFCIHLSEAFNHAQSTWKPDESGTGWLQRLSDPQPPGREKARFAALTPRILHMRP